MNSSSAAPNSFSVHEAPTAPTASSVRPASQPPPSKADVIALRQKRKRERKIRKSKKRQWKCTVMSCVFHHQPLDSQQVLPGRGGQIRCPRCRRQTLVDANMMLPHIADRGQNYFCKNKCQHHNPLNPVTPQMREKQANVNRCPGCGDSSLVPARSDGFPTWYHVPEQDDINGKDDSMNNCEHPDDDLRDPEKYPGQHRQRSPLDVEDGDEMREREGRLDATLASAASCASSVSGPRTTT